MFDTLSRWKRKFSSSASSSQTSLIPTHQSTNANDVRSHSSSAGGTGTGSRQFLSISQPIPRSSPSSLSGSIIRSGSGGAGDTGSIIYATGGFSASGGGGDDNNPTWEDQRPYGIEDNRPMGSLGRRRMGSASSGSSGHGVGIGLAGDEEELIREGGHVSSSSSAPTVVRMDSEPPRHHPYQPQYQQQYHPQTQQYYQPRQPQFHHPTPRGALRLQTDVQPSYDPNTSDQSYQQPQYHPPHQQQRQPIPFGTLPPHTARQLSPIVEVSPTSTSADYQSLKGAGSILGSITGSGTPSSPSTGGIGTNPRNSNATGSRRRSGSVGSGPSVHVSAGGESGASTGTGVGTVGSSRRHSGVGMNGNGMMLSVGGGNGNGGGGGGGLSPATPGTASGASPSAGTNHGDLSFTSGGGAGSPLSQYATPTTASASPGGPGVSPNTVVPPSSSSSTGVHGVGVGASGSMSSRSGTPEISRPSPAYSSPFITRQLNRTASQTSSRSRGGSSSTSTIPGPTATPAVGPNPGGSGASTLGRQGSIRSVTTSTTRQEQQHSGSGTPTLIGSGSTPSTGGADLSHPFSSTSTAVASTTLSDPPVIPPLNFTPPFPGPHPVIGPRSTNGRGRRTATTWSSRGKGVGVGVMPKIPGSLEGYYDEYEDEEDEEEEGDYDVDDDDYYEEEGGYEEGVSAPGEEMDDGYGYGYGYGYGMDCEAGYGEQEEEQERMSYGEKETIRYADYVRRGYGGADDMEAGPSSSGIAIHVEEYVDPPNHEHGCPNEDGTTVHDPTRLRPFGPRAHEPRVPSSESFITRRWSRDRARGIPTDTNRMRHSINRIFHLRAKKQRRWFGLANLTPAFWAFWFGFICPVLWLVGGWHFTNFGEQPPRMGVWEFYFSGRGLSGGFLREVFCCCLPGRRRIVVEGGDGGAGGGAQDVKGKARQPRLNGPRNRKQVAEGERTVPRWISEKQCSEDGRARLNDPNDLKRSLRGISFGYPFIARPALPPATVRRGVPARTLGILGKPNRVLDLLYGVRLREVRGRPESPRRMFDPWIQRCRYALCYACALMGIGMCAASMYLIVFNTRQL